MKQLLKTEDLIRKLAEEKTIENYILLVGCGEDEWQLTSEKVDLDSYFDAASVGKVFPTSTLALMAIDRGMLSLEDTLEKFFPNVTPDKKDITVKQLMTHTSGMLRREFPDGIADRGRDGILDFVFTTPLAYEPGTRCAYCCTGLTLLGFILEKVYGDGDLNDIMQKYLCKPLGLTRSRYNIAPDTPNAVNCNHNTDIRDIRWDDNNVSKMNGIPSGSGGLFITAGDMQKLVKALINCDERLYSKATFEISERNYTGGLPTLDNFRGVEKRGLGFVYVDECCEQARELFPTGSIGHCGWTGQSFFLSREKKLYVILLTDATRCNAKKNGGNRVNSDDIHNMRIAVHRAIKEDLDL